MTISTVVFTLGLAAATTDPCLEFMRPPNKGDVSSCAADPTCPDRLMSCLRVVADRTRCVNAVTHPGSIPRDTCDATLLTLFDHPKDGPVAINRVLDGSREDFGSIKKWASSVAKALREKPRAASTADVARVTRGAAVDALRDEVWSALRQAMRERGLYEPIFGELVTATSSATVGEETATLEPEQAQKAAYVVFESRHQDLVGRFDASLSGRFGFQPLFAMHQPATADDAACGGAAAKTAPSAPASRLAPCLPAFQSGFVWDLGGKVNLRAGWGGEGSLFFRSGQSRLLGPGIIVGGDTSAPSVELPVGREDGDTRWAHEVGLRWVLFVGDDENDRAHERRILDPLFEVSAGLRRDDRFRDELFPGSEAPRDRYFFRFFVNVKIPGPALVDQPLAIAFGVEHEGARHGGAGSIPSGTRFILRGDLNLIKALTGGNP